MSSEYEREEIAIVGMAGRFPGARNVEEFWTNLRDGVESIRRLTEAELDAAGVNPEIRSDPDFVNAGSVMDEADAFDASFFGMTRREAELTDPQHRVFLECAWEAIEHSGYDPRAYDGRVGVFGGVAANTYFQKNLVVDSDLIERTGSYPLLIASEREYAITRVAYKLGLTGPAVSVNTACSTSAVAVHLACQSLLSGESDLALAGGARIRVPLTGGYVYQEDGILSPDGHCRTFDADARGTVAASGAAVVTLKRLSDALHDGDTVYAIVKGTAINNDGDAKIGYTAPGVRGQVAVIQEALAVAEVSADTVEMVEAHGTGTSLGDPIEVAALTKAYRPHTERRQYCAIGSLKANIGHLDAGAGVAGIIKAALALHHQLIPPSINFHSPNPQIDFCDSPFFVNTSAKEWKGNGGPRRAAVSSFGLGGTNAHVILEEGPRPEPAASNEELVLLPVSARTETALATAKLQLADHLARSSDSLADIAFTLQAGRSAFDVRQSLVAVSTDEAIEGLRAGGTPGFARRLEQPEVVFLFPGGGAQHVGMAAGLFDKEPVFRRAIEECAQILLQNADLDLLALLFPSTQPENAGLDLERVSIALPTLFSVEYALAQLWLSWGISPDALIGHSLGEYVAATLAGVFSLEDGLRVVSVRGRLMEEAPTGSMISVAAPVEQASLYVDDSVSLAVVNTPENFVLSGTQEVIDRLAERLSAEDIDARPIPIAVASHSHLMEPILERFRDFLGSVDMKKPSLRFVSNVTGSWIDEELATTPEYWTTHLRNAVRFGDGIGMLLSEENAVLIEVGPGQVLTSLARMHPSFGAKHRVVPSLPQRNQDVTDDRFFLGSVGAAWQAGVEVDWTRSHNGRSRRRIAIPTYPFEHERYWIAPHRGPSGVQSTPTEVDSAVTLDLRAADPKPEKRSETPAATRAERIQARLSEILTELSGASGGSLDPAASFIDLGFDSLFLTQANSRFRREFGVRITFRQLFEEAPSLASLASFIDKALPADAFQPEEPEAVEPDPVAPPVAALAGATSEQASQVLRIETGATSGLERVVSEQLAIMQKQLDLLAGDAAGTGSDEAAESTGSTSRGSHPDEPRPAGRTHYLSGSGAAPATRAGGIESSQRAAIDDLVGRYNARTPKSKELAQLWRPRLADNRTIVGFDPAWKELVYQIVSDRSEGARIWDVDGNEYIDTALGFGTNLLGHSPPAVVEAVQKQLGRGFEVGVQNHMLGSVTEKICAMTGMDRLAYTYSGCEAVVTAIRIARTVTGRDKIAYFTDDIHGRSDIVLGRAIGSGEGSRTVPLVAGVPQHVVDDALVLDYGSPEALDAIRAQASELALVLVEPVRTRNPELQPLEFLRELRELATKSGFLLVFDEIVTGFRSHPGGVQALFDVRADVTTYGKVLGGGLPIGVVAGKAEYIDVIDGGPWQFGDESYPEGDVTASGGTMIKHPLTLAAANAVLDHLGDEGPSLQENLTLATAGAVDAISDYYRSHGFPIQVEHFSSFFRPRFEATRFAGLFQYYLREHGVHTNPPSASFLSTAHNEQDIEVVVEGYQRAARAMADDGLLTDDEPKSRRLAPDSDLVQSERPVPVLPNVARFLAERSSPDQNHWNLGVLLRPERPLDAERTKELVKRLVLRHDALRLRFFENTSGWQSSIAQTAEPTPFSTHDLSGVSAEDQESAIKGEAEALQRSLNLARGPLLRVALFDLGGGEQRLLIIIHHFAMDGLSWRPFWEDFSEVDRALETGEEESPLITTPFEEWAHVLKRRADSDELREEMHAWLDLNWERVRQIPQDFPDQDGANTNGSAREVILDFSKSETDAVFLETPAVRQKIDLLLTALAQTVGGWTGSDAVLFDMMGHGREEEMFEEVDLFGTIGFFISYTPMLLTLTATEPSDHQPLLTDQIHPILRRGLTFDLLRYMSSDATVRQTFRSLPRAQILFNHQGRRSRLDTVPPGSQFTLAPESSGSTHSPRGIRYYPLAISSEVWMDQLRLKFVYSENLHKTETITALAGNFKAALLRLAAHQPR